MDNTDDGLVRFGILGCANIARKMSRAIMQTPGVCLHAIGSRSLEKAQAFAKDNAFPSGAKIYGSYQSVLDDDAVDAVYIPLPTSLHVEWALKASAKKKHILLEKPPALSTGEFDKIVSACEKEGVQLMDCTMWMHHPRTIKMEELLRKQNVLGNILDVHATFFLPMRVYAPDFFTQNIRCNADLDALGALGDLGWYCARAILWAYDYEVPASVVALPGAQFTEGGVITRCSASLVWDDGRVALLHCSFHANMAMNLSVYGSKGTMEVHDFVIPYKENSASFKVCSSGGQESVDVDTNNTQTQESQMLHKFASIVKAIRSGSDGLEPFWPTISRKTQQVLDAIKLSIDKGYTKVHI